VPSNIVSRQPSQGADGESEFDEEAVEVDELMSDAEDVKTTRPSASKKKVTAEKRQKRKEDEGHLQVKRQEMDKAKVRSFLQVWCTGLTFSKVTDAVKRYSYLLGQTELFKHFVDIKVGTTFFGSASCNIFLAGPRPPIRRPHGRPTKAQRARQEKGHVCQ